MRVVILCGGQGTRLREETEYKPKPLVEIGGRPIIWHIMKTYSAFGFNSFVLCLGHKGEKIKDFFLNYRVMAGDVTMRLGREQMLSFHDPCEEEFEVTLAETGEDTMTGARIKRVQRFIPDDIFMVTYGDGVADIDVSRLLDFHKKHGKIATVTAVLPFSRFGVLNLDRERVESFTEKPRGDGWSSAGYFVFDYRIFDYLRPEKDCVLERAPLERLATDGELVAYKHDGFFLGMDTYREYVHLNEMWASGTAPWKIW